MKNWMKGANTAVLSLAVIGIFIVVTVFLHSLKGVQWDLTKNKKFSLAEQTVTTLKNIEKPVHVTYFTDPSQPEMNRQITDLLEEYRKRTGKFTYEEVDAKKQPSVAERYKIDQLGTLVFESEGKTKNVAAYNLFGAGSTQTSYAFSGEEKFTQAILGLSSSEKHTVYFLSGHGELPASNAGAFRSSLENEGYVVKDLNLVKDAKIPDDAETLFVLAPQNDVSDAEAKLVQDYLNGKGKLMFSLSLAKDMDKWKNWNAVLGQVGIKNAMALAVETKKTLSSDPLAVVPEYGSHPITDKLKEQDRVAILPAALALSDDPNNKDVLATPLLQTSDQSYGVTNLALFTSNRQLTMNDIKQTDKDVKGPLHLAYAVQTKDSKPKAIVIGNAVFLQNDYLDAQGNRDFALNSVGWLQEQKNAVTIRPKEDAQLQQALILPAQANAIFIGTVVAIPLLLLLTGGFIWWRRRRG